MSIFKKCAIFLAVMSYLSQSAIPCKAVQGTTDFTAPSVPTGLVISNRTCTTLVISWNASSDNTAVRGYQVYRNGRKIITISKTNYTNTDLIPGMEYTYTIRAYDAAGNVSDGSVPLKVATLSDLQDPSIPGGLSYTSVGYTSITLSWKPSTDNTSIKGYDIYCNGSRKASSTGTTYICKGLVPGKNYTFSLKAYDIAGNFSDECKSVIVSTLPDNQAPSVPVGIKVTGLSGVATEIEWTPSSDNVKVKGYEIFCDGEKIGKTTKTSFEYKKLIPGKSYSLSVRAYDITGNISANSEAIKITATKDSGAPTAPVGLKIKSISGTSISLTWSESEDDIEVKGYRIYCNGLQIATSTRESKAVKLSKDLFIGIIYVKAYDLVGNLSPASNKVTVVF